MKFGLRFAILQSKMRGPSGEKILSEQLVSTLKRNPLVRECRYFITSDFPGGKYPVVSDELLAEIKAYKPDVLFVFSVWMPRLALDCIQVYCHVNMWRGGHNHDGTPRSLAELGYDIFLTNSRITVRELRECGANGVYWPLYADPEIFRPVRPVEEYVCDVVYIGGNMSFKTPEAVSRYIEPCTHFDFHLYGLDWELHPVLKDFAKGVLPEGRIPEVYSSAKIVIGFNAPSQSRWGMINNRVFEALGCEACLLSDRLPEIEREFSGACAFTDGWEDTRRRIEYLLERPEERAQMGKLGRKIVAERHSVERRVETLLQEVAKLLQGRRWFLARLFGYGKLAREASAEGRPSEPAAAETVYPALCFKHHFLRDNTADVIACNPWLADRFRILDLTEPFGAQVSEDMWQGVPSEEAVGIVWGMRKYGAQEFAEYAEKIGLPYIFVERSPLLIGGRKSYYLDPCGTTDHGYLCNPGFIEWLYRKPFGEKEKAEIEAYRESCRGISSGVDIQAAPFESRAEIIDKLGLPQQSKILFVPLQVDDDMTIIDKKSSPFIDSMLQFLTLLIENVDHLPQDYRVIVKEHPANIRYKQELAHDLSHPRVVFIRDEVNVNSLSQQCDAIFSVNSGVGMEGLVFHKPLFSCGNSFYSGKGINWDIRSGEDLRKAFAKIDEYRVDKERVDRFLHYFIFEYSYDLAVHGDSMRLAEKLWDIAVRGKTPQESLAPMIRGRKC